MKKKLQKITVLIPCHNEEEGIGAVIDGFPKVKLKKKGYSLEIIVIDNNSSDKTREVALSHGATVIEEPKKGKGNALRTGFNVVSEDSKYVVMLDGDNTYKGEEVLRLIEPIESGFCDVIVGSRLGGKMKKNAFQFKNRLANWFFTFLVRQFYKANVTDVLSGYFAWKKEVVDELKCHLESEGFAIEMEMITKMVKLDYTMYSVPITYDTREGETKLSALRDGSRIIFALGKYIFWEPKKDLCTYDYLQKTND